MLTRIISGFFLTVIMFAGIWFGDITWLILISVISLMGFFEIGRAVSEKEKKKPDSFDVIGFIGIIGYDTILYIKGMNMLLLACILLTLLVFMVAYVMQFPKYRCEKAFTAFFAFVYAPVMLSFMYLTRELPKGIFLVWLVFASSWLSDTFAYFFGRALGKHKLAPVLSPKKSIEGSIGGIFGAAVISAVYGLILYKTGAMDNSNIIWIFAIIGAAGSVISQIGDLVASGIKRDHNIKDYSHLIPGHGGIMDRFDSTIVTAPIIYFLSYYFLG